MTTLLLNPPSWDLTVNTHGDIALADDPYAIAQDVASACRLFLGELWYDQRQGVPYFEEILGKFPPAHLLKERLVEAAMSVPDVLAARAYLTALRHRVVGGQVQFATIMGFTFVVGTDNLQGALPWYVANVSREAARPGNAGFGNFIFGVTPFGGELL